MVMQAISIPFMTPTLIGIGSGVLILLGVVLIVRDILRSREERRRAAQARTATPPGSSPPSAGPMVRTEPAAAGVSSPLSQASDSELVIIRRSPSEQPVNAQQAPAPSPAPLSEVATFSREATPPRTLPAEVHGARDVGERLRRLIEEVGGQSLDASPESARTSAAERAWGEAAPILAGVLAQANDVIGRVGLRIEPPGTASWSFKNRGYGVHHRLLVGGESRAWLRAECDGQGGLVLKLRSHQEDHASINATARVEAGSIGVEKLSDAVVYCLETVVGGVAWAVAKDELLMDRVPGWSDVEKTVEAAVQMVSTAFAQADASLVPAGEPTYDAETGRWRWPVSVVHAGNVIAMMYIDRDGPALDVAVGVADPHQAALARRKRIEIEEATAHSVAEAIASAAWPVIATSRERGRSGRSPS